MTLIKKTTIREYNLEGKVIKKIVTEEYAAQTSTLPNPWWTKPLISNGSNTICVNGDPYDNSIEYDAVLQKTL